MEEHEKDIDRNAPVITQDEIVIAALHSTVWNLLADIAGWPEWQKEIESASLDGPLAVEAVFHWTTAGLEITSTVGELIPQERIAWSGPVQGIVGVQVWRFTPVRDGVRVQTEESWDGEGVRREREGLQHGLDQPIHSWLPP